MSVKYPNSSRIINVKFFQEVWIFNSPYFGAIEVLLMLWGGG